MAIGTIGTALDPSFWPVAIFQVLNGGADACFAPAIAAISLGLVGRAAFTYRIGRNESFNHGGNVATAILAGVGGYLFAPVAMLWIVAILAVASIAATLFIDPAAIDNDRARGADVDGHRAQPSGLRVIFEMQAAADFHGRDHAVSFRQRRDAAAARRKARGQPSADRHAVHGVMHHRRAGRDGSDGGAGRA